MHTILPPPLEEKLIVSEFLEKQRILRRRARVSNALRIIADSGDCLVDRLDISEHGLGIDYFDMLNRKPQKTISH